MEPQIQPLSYKKRRLTFAFLLTVFLLSLPFLYLYATGYKFNILRPTDIISTGGIYVAVDRTGAEIYIDDELVRETRTFRKAFYAQNLYVGTHRVHVQKEGYHTWVKELPVSKHLVTEAEAFNLPLVPNVRVISPLTTATGTQVVPTLPAQASSTNSIVATTTMSTSTLLANPEYETLFAYFGTTSTSTTEVRPLFIPENIIDQQTATTTIVSGGVELRRVEDTIVAAWVGSPELMPYYYCAPDFPPYSTSTATSSVLEASILRGTKETVDEQDDPMFMHPIQTVPNDAVCVPHITIDAKDKEVLDFDFFPGSTDHVILVQADGIYVAEIDDRAWQNFQPLLLGEDLQMHIENGIIFVYDGSLIYQVIVTSE